MLFGTGLFGKVEVVPGVCYVATSFFHVNFIPLVPTESWVIIAGSEKVGLLRSEWNGFELSTISVDSVVVSWLRFVMFVLCAALGFVGAARLETEPNEGVAFLALAVASAIGFFVSYRMSRATHESLRKVTADAAFPADFARKALAALGEEPTPRGR